MISVIMAAFNAEETIKASIDSVLSQTYPYWELIVIDDHSSDGTSGIIESLITIDTRIRRYTNEKNVGVASTRNYGISQAQGQYIAFLDSDDLWHREKLKIQLDFMQANDASISYTATAYIYEGSHSNYILHAKQGLTYKELLKRNLMSCSSVIVRKEIIERFPFPQGNIHEDYAVWLKILREKGLSHGINEPLLIYRASRSSKSGKLYVSGIMTYYAYRNVGFSPCKSLLLAIRYSLHSIVKRASIRIRTKL